MRFPQEIQNRRRWKGFIKSLNIDVHIWPVVHQDFHRPWRDSTTLNSNGNWN